MRWLSTIVLACVLATAIALDARAEGARPGSPVIGVLAFDDVLTSEVTAPVEVFGAASTREWFAGAKVLVVSGSERTTIRTAEGLRLLADTTIHDAPPLDVLIVPGAYDLEALTANEAVTSFIRKAGGGVDWLASNCSGAFLLAHAGLLDGLRATTWAGGESALKEAYPEVNVQVDRNVVVDGRVITSNGGVVSYEAAITLLGRLSSEEHAREIADAIQLPRVNRRPD